MPVERTLRVHLMIEGEPAPEGLTAHFSVGTMMSPRRIALTTDASGTAETKYAPPAGQKAIPLSLSLAGHRQTEPVHLDLTKPGDIEATLHFTRLGTLHVHVELPSDNRCRIGLELADRASGKLDPGAQFGRRPDQNGRLVFHVTPGSYRAVDHTSGQSSEVVQVVASEDPATVSLDLSKAGWVRGHIVVPEGMTWQGFSVRRVGAPLRPPSHMMFAPGASDGARVNTKDGSFWFRVPGTKAVTLTVAHSYCRPHPTRGTMTVTEPQEGVTLEATAGPRASLQFAKPITIRMNPGSARSVAVRLFEGAVEGPGTVLHGTLDKDAQRATFGGFEPGTYTLWLDATAGAPLVLRNVELGDEDVDLGEHELPAGSALVLRILVKAGQSPPRMHLSANRVGEPSYSRHTDATGETIRLTGLDAGTFHVRGAFYAGTGGIDERITFDGTTDVERTIDLR